MEDYLDKSPMWFRVKNKVGNLLFFETLKYFMWLLWFHFHHEVTFQFKHIWLRLSLFKSFHLSLLQTLSFPKQIHNSCKTEAECSSEMTYKVKLYKFVVTKASNILCYVVSNILFTNSAQPRQLNQ
jgi:hypothetical protein